ncbi:MAG: agmatine deiminase family protein [Sulfurovum sp.]|nr:agmatine deiminase family protein [Sulfurovum sp.]
MRVIPAEWEKQACVLMSFPHQNTDWYEEDNKASLDEALCVFIRIAQAIAYRQAVYIVCDDKIHIASLFCSTRNLTFIEIETNDTWIRDYGMISCRENAKNTLLDFTFDGWGGKFDARLDTKVNHTLQQKGYMGITPLVPIDFVLEGGAIESDGEGTIMTTSSCLCHPNRNGGLSKPQVEARFLEYLGAERILWLDHGYLAGDDTDGHIDTLARFINRDTIVYVKSYDKEDEHHASLSQMEQALQAFRTKEGKPYHLIALPMSDAIYNTKQERLATTYANFLIINHAVLYPTYNDRHDKEVGLIFKRLFPDKECIPILCLKLVEQGGSLHCSTMQIGYEESL